MLAEDRPAYGHRIDLLTLVDQLQEVIETSSRIPLSDRIVVSSDALLDLVDAIRSTIPQDVIEAERILQERHRLVDEAHQEADQLLESAREQSRFMLQDHHIVKAAEMKAERLLNQAQREADEVMESADEYVHKLFSQFEDEAVRLAAEIRRVAAHRS